MMQLEPMLADYSAEEREAIIIGVMDDYNLSREEAIAHLIQEIKEERQRERLQDYENTLYNQRL
jgi:hypothetical protein